ncbi:MAG: hypothetical protein WC707_01110 [Candidatus Babeliaceae bacterium]|jgi:hypothetical protein
MYCAYYQSPVVRQHVSFFVATLRAHEHLCFDRTLDAQNQVFEFFVPEKNVALFESIMNIYVRMGVIYSFTRMHNRLTDPTQSL